MKLSELIQPIQPLQIVGGLEKEITGLNIDSRLVEPGHLFIAVHGTQADGHAYIASAIEKGASAVVCQQMPETLVENITYILVADSEVDTVKIATHFYGNPTTRLSLVGVTGTNGKT